jgi:Arc/MetJ-type ribon-helix-helix transcriptional regulator
MCGESGEAVDGSVWDAVREQLGRLGIHLDTCCARTTQGPIKVVCVASNLKESVEELGRTTRDQVVMVRIDEDTSRALDAWVETGHVKSRSEAAAVFIREGVKLRAKELEQLAEALREVEEAKKRLREKARTVFGAAE